LTEHSKNSFSQIPEGFRSFDSVISHRAIDEPVEEQDWVVASNATLENMHSPGGYLSECSESDGIFSVASPQSAMSRASSTSTQASVIKINTNYIDAVF